MVTEREREARLLAAGWIRDSGCWRLAAIKRVYQVATLDAAEAIQSRLDAAKKGTWGHRVMPGSGLT